MNHKLIFYEKDITNGRCRHDGNKRKCTTRYNKESTCLLREQPRVRK